MRLDTAPRRCRVFGAVSCEIVSIMVPPDNYLPSNGARRGRGAALDTTGHQGRRVESAELLVVEEFRDGGWQRNVLMCVAHEHVHVKLRIMLCTSSGYRRDGGYRV